MADEPADVHPPFPGNSDNLHMKPLLSVAVTEAVKLALIDSCVWPGPRPDGEHIWEIEVNGEVWHFATDQEKAAAYWDSHNIPPEALSSMDPVALAQNVCCRLLSPGNWVVGAVYSGNASPGEILDACVHRPDEDPLGGIKMALGLREDPDDG